MSFLVPPTQVYLKGFILVGHTTLGGDLLIFRYPPVKRHKISDETLIAMMGKSGKSEKDIGLKIQQKREPPTSTNEVPVSISYTEEYTPYDMPSVMICNFLSPKQQLCDRVFEVVIDNYRFIGHPTTLKKQEIKDPFSQRGESSSSEKLLSKKLHSSQNSSGSSSSLGDANEHYHKDELTMFNLVLVVSKNIDKGLLKMSKKIASQLSIALKHEQERCNYLTNEVIIMLKRREKWLSQYQRTNEDQKPDHTLLAYDILKHSSLAKFIKKVYHGIRDDGSIHKVLNNWISMSLSIRDMSEYKRTDIRPYHALLVLDLEDCLESIPKDASLNLVYVIKYSVQMKSMREMEIDLRVPRQQLYLIASHLEYWGKAKIIESLSQYNVYILNTKMNSGDTYLHSIAPKFQELFQIQLTAVLEQFSFPQALHENNFAQEEKFVEIVIWLLRHDLVVQIFPYFYLILPCDQTQQSVSDRSSLFPSKQELGVYLQKLTDGSKEHTTLTKIASYLNGRYRLSEISWREQIKIEDIMQTIEKYSDSIVTTYHE